MRVGRSGADDAIRVLRCQLVLTGVLAASLSAQSAVPISDNSFLVEEAYNQERGVVQHIGLFVRDQAGRWSYSFTQEWPVRGARHQLSYALQLLKPEGGATGRAGFGDLAINYRWQLSGGGSAGLSVAPRISVVLPTGQWRESRGDGALGLEVALPVSVVLAPRWRAHLNASVMAIPGARNEAGSRADLMRMKGGASVVYLLRPHFNLLTEALFHRAVSAAGLGLSEAATGVLLIPGFRWAIGVGEGIQVVPGLAYQLVLVGAKDREGPLAYLSVEHPFR